MKTMHDDILNGGHVGVDALSIKITNKYYWKGMYEDILQYVRACRTCALRKRAPHFIVGQVLGQTKPRLAVGAM